MMNAAAIMNRAYASKFTSWVIYGFADAPPDAPAADATMMPVETSSGTSVASQGPSPSARHAGRVNFESLLWKRNGFTMCKTKPRDVLAPKRLEMYSCTDFAAPAKQTKIEQSKRDLSATIF